MKQGQSRGSFLECVNLRWLLMLCLVSFSTSAVAGEVKDAGLDHPDTVRIGAFILSIHDLNFHEREYTIRFWVWMRYKNAAFHFDRYVEVPDAKMIEKPDTISEPPGSENDSLYTIYLKMKCVMKQEWDVSHFPFDRQILTIWVENTKYETDSLVFTPDASGRLYDPHDPITVEGWHLDSVTDSVDTHLYPSSFGAPPDTTSTYSRYSLRIAIHREPWGLFFKIFMGMYVAFIIAFVAFFIHPDTVDPRFGIPIGALIAVVGNKYIIEPLLPEASTLTIVDSLHVITLGFIFLILVVSAVSLSKHWKEASDWPRKLNFYGAAFIAITYPFINLILILRANLMLP